MPEDEPGRSVLGEANPGRLPLDNGLLSSLRWGILLHRRSGGRLPRSGVLCEA